MKKATPYALHTAFDVDRSISMTLIGGKRKAEAIQLASYVHGFRSYDWPAKLNRADKELGRQYDFNPVACVMKHHEGEYVEDPDFVQFNGSMDDAAVRIAFRSWFPVLNDYKLGVSAFRSWFAHLHRDHVDVCRAMLMIVLDNKQSHRLLSIDKAGNHHILAPRQGDVVFLDTRCRHAVLPNQADGIRAMKENPMSAIFVVPNDIQERD
jgi:hypothetical protein